MTNNPRYTLGTEANRIFMASETYELLKFGKGFPAPVSYTHLTLPTICSV